MLDSDTLRFTNRFKLDFEAFKKKKSPSITMTPLDPSMYSRSFSRQQAGKLLGTQASERPARVAV